MSGDAGLGSLVVPHLVERRFDQRLHQLPTLGPLHRQHRPRRRNVGHADPGGVLKIGPQPFDDLLAIARVDDEQMVAAARGVLQTIEQHVVEDSAPLVGDERVANLARLHVADAARQQSVEEVADVDAGGSGAVEAESSHVGDVEQSDGGTDGGMFIGDRGVLHRHRPAGEVDHSAAVRSVPVVQGSASQILRHWAGPVGSAFERSDSN